MKNESYTHSLSESTHAYSSVTKAVGSIWQKRRYRNTTEVPMIMKEVDKRNVEMLLAKSHSTKTRWHSVKVVGGEFKTDK